MFVVISYDIKDDKRRNKVLNELKNYGNHVQYSVFECDINKKQIEGLQTELNRLINNKQDSIGYYFLCKNCIERINFKGRRFYAISLSG